jgi:beta-mannosidase
VADVDLVAPNGRITSLTVPLASDGAVETLSGESSVLVEDSELWWTHDLGGQPRYQVTIRLREGEQILDERRDLVGLRRGAARGGGHARWQRSLLARQALR